MPVVEIGGFYHFKLLSIGGQLFYCHIIRPLSMSYRMTGRFSSPQDEAYRNLKYFDLLADRKMSFVEFSSRTFWIEMLNIISKY